MIQKIKDIYNLNEKHTCSKISCDVRNGLIKKIDFYLPSNINGNAFCHGII